MQHKNERRREKRLRYYWPIWFARDLNHKLSQGQMVDISSEAASFTCYTDEEYPYLGQPIIARFSVPRYGPDDSFDMADFTRAGHICRIEEVNNYLRRIAFQFAEPLPFKPGEQSEEDLEVEITQEAAAI